MRFNSDKFSFNNIHCKAKNVSLLWGDDAFITYGLSMDKPMEYDGLSWKSTEDNQPDTIMLHIVHEINDVAQVWTKEKIKDIESWLITDDFVPFVSEDDINTTYYFKTVKITRRFNNAMLGWLEVEFQPISQYGYLNETVTLKNTARFMNMRNIPSMTIVNKNDSNKNHYPIIKLDNLVGSVTINNLTTETSFTLNANGDITIDNKMRNVFDDKGNNLLASCNRKWIYLTKGTNRIQVVGNCTVSVISQYEVRV